jgi:Tfp pilus assembly protein PilF
MSIPQAYGMAWQYYHTGQWQQAEQLFRQILQADANQVEALHLLGVIAFQTGRINLAVDYLHAAVRLKPDFAEAHNNLGVALQKQGKWADAALAYQQALRMRPDAAELHHDLGIVLQQQGRLAEATVCLEKALHLRQDYVEAHINLGNALQQQGKLAEAVASYQRALQLKPDCPGAHLNLGVALQAQGKPAEALASYQQALQRDPNSAEAHNNLGNLLREQGKLAEAVVTCQQALRLRPDYAEAHNNLGIALEKQGKLVEAEASYRQALRLLPDFAEAHNNLGNVLQTQGKLTEAVASYQQALRHRPDYPEAHRNLGLTLRDEGQLEEAMISLECALRLKPDFADAHHSRSQLWLLQGDFEQGWPEYEWRWQIQELRNAPSSRRPEPRWDGSALDGKTILLHVEQGVGDTLQFIRYASVVKERGATVVVECPSALMGVLAGCPGIDRLVRQGGPLPACDVQAALLSLPGLCGTTLATIPAKVPYLIADRARVAHWQEGLAGLSGFKVGICWQGNPGHQQDAQRSVLLSRLAPMAKIPGLRLVSLQKGPGQEQWTARPRSWPVVDLPDQRQELSQAWEDTAALICALDLVITVDTAVAHLAGALAMPVWVPLPFSPDWRWLLGRENSPWYPTMRLFRQPQRGNWDEVFDRIAGEVSRKLSQR